MTTPNLDVTFENFMLSYVLSPQAPGFQFAKSLKPTLKTAHEIPIPVGVNTVQVVYHGASSVNVELRQPGKESFKPSRLQIPAGSETRTVVAEIPVSENKAVMTFTITNAWTSEVGQPVMGVKIFPVPPAGQ